jgi:hypothetical protein
MPSVRLTDAYDLLHHMGPEYDGDEHGNNGLTNHGPMVAEVLDRRGYDMRISPWVTRYVTRLRELPAGRESIDEANWGSALGDGGRVGDWTAYFSRQLGDRMWHDVLAEWWPRLLPGIAAGATHGVIRVALAVLSLARAFEPAAPQLDELAHGLAFWAARSRAVPATAPPAGPLEAAQALDGIPHLADQSGLIVHRLGRLAELPGWPAAQQALRAPQTADDVPPLLRQLVHATTVRYLGSGYGSPVLLVHTATAPNAVLRTLPYLPEDQWAPSLAAVWSAIAAIIAAYEPSRLRPRGDWPRPAAGDGPDAAVERAAAHGDEHVIKFTDTAAEVFSATGDQDVLTSAAHIAQLIAPPGSP